MAATTRPEDHQQHEQRDQEADARVAEVSSSALRKTASPPSSTWRPERRSPRRPARESTVNAGLPSSRSGRVEGEHGVPDPAVLRDGAGRERVGDRHDVVGAGDVGQDRVDRRAG